MENSWKISAAALISRIMKYVNQFMKVLSLSQILQLLHKSKKSSRYFHQESIHIKASCFHSNILSTKTLAEHIFRILFKMLFDWSCINPSTIVTLVVGRSDMIVKKSLGSFLLVFRYYQVFFMQTVKNYINILI